MTEASIEVRGLTKVFGGSAALQNATFYYEGAGAIGYLGPNGAGKTTTLKLLTGLLRPSSGGAWIDGIEVASDRKHALADVGAIIESPEPYPSQTVREAIETAAEFRSGAAKGWERDIADLDVRLELPPLSARCGRLSKGQRQRVSIAASLIGNPSVLILDEPTSGLDPKERILIRELLNALKRDHLLLMSSHLMAEVTEICGQVIFVNQGRILLRDTVEHLADRFRSTAVEVEFGAPVSPEQVRALGPPVGEVTAIADRRFRIAFDGTADARAQLLHRLETLGPVLAYQSASLELEDAYLAVMRGDDGGAAPAGSSRRARA
jgi:ABC-2 type transport system ATP-binding protein